MESKICNILEQHDGKIKYNTLLGKLADVNPIEIDVYLDLLNNKGKITANKGVISLVHNPASVVESAPVESAEEVANAPEGNVISSVPVPGASTSRAYNLNAINHMAKDSITNRLIKTIKQDGFVKCSNNGLLYRYSNGVYKHYNNMDYNMYIEREIAPYLDKEIISNVRTMAVNSLGIYKPIHHNILAFNNGYYNTDTGVFTAGDYKEGIPYYTFNIDYNPNAEPGEYFKKYWGNYDEELQNQLLELVGSLLQKGNPRKKVFMLVGQGDTGKSVFISILNYILEATSELDLATIIKGGHELSALLYSNVNFCNDEKGLTVEDNGTLKQFTGNDNIMVNAKYKEPVTLKGNDVPKLVVVANNLVKFKNNERAIIDRLGIIKMYLEERISKSEQDELLHEKIIAESSSLEWLIFNALEKLKSLKEHYNPSWDMSFKTDEEVYDIIAVLSEPVRYFLEKGFTYDSTESNFEYDYNSCSFEGCYITEEELQTYLRKACSFEKVQLNKTNNKGKVKPKVINGYMEDVFGVKKYTYKNKRVNGKHQRVYYNLKPTDYYYKVIA